MPKNNQSRQQKSPRSFSVHTFELIRAARELGLKYQFFTPPHEKFEKCAIIYAKNKQLITIGGNVMNFNNIVATKIADKKPLANFVLRNANISVPNLVVINSVSDFQKSDLTFPVVVKPLSAHGGQGISVKIKNIVELKSAIIFAQKESMSSSGKKTAEIPVAVEEMFSGFDHRLLIFDNQFIAAVKKIPASVTGDGKNSVKQLIYMANQTPIRKTGQLGKIKINDDLLKHLTEQKLSLDTILPKNKIIYLRLVSNLSVGGTTENVTDKVHPQYKKIAIAAAKACGLKIAGVDLMTKDISSSPKPDSYKIIEINASPGFRLHLHPAVGDPIDVPKIILQKYFGLNK